MMVYVDDVIIYTKAFEEHLRAIEEVFRRLKKHGLYVKPTKCAFAQFSVRFLGYIIDHEGNRTDPLKVEAVRKYTVPINVTETRGFLGLASYYQRFVEGFAAITKPLNQLLKKDAPFEWKEPQQKAFESLKDH